MALPPKSIPVKIIGKIPNDDVITFNDISEINRYINDNADVLQGYTSQRLNNSLKIDGYRVGRRHGKIVLIKDVNENSIMNKLEYIENVVSQTAQVINTLMDRIEQQSQIDQTKINTTKPII